MGLQQPLWLLLILVIPLVFLGLRRKGHLRISSSKTLGLHRLPRVLRVLPESLLACSLVAALIALAAPFAPDVPSTKKIMGRDIIVAVDISPSMYYDFNGTLPELQGKIPELDLVVPRVKGKKKAGDPAFESPESKKDKLRRIDAAQSAIMNFVRNRFVSGTGDRIGMIAFDSRPRIAWPLTHDLRQLYRKGQFLDLGMGMGTNFGGSPPGPLDLAAEQFDELGEAKSKVIILVTDGEDYLDYSTQVRLIELLKKRNIKLYLVGVGETLATRDVDIIQVAEKVGGKNCVFRVENAKSMTDCFNTIDELEKSAVTYEQMAEQKQVFFYFAWSSLVLFGFGLLAEWLIVNQ